MKKSKKKNEKVKSIEMNVLDREMTHEQVEIANKLIEYAEKTGYRVNYICFSAN